MRLFHFSATLSLYSKHSFHVSIHESMHFTSLFETTSLTALLRDADA